MASSPESNVIAAATGLELRSRFDPSEADPGGCVQCLFSDDISLTLRGLRKEAIDSHGTRLIVHECPVLSPVAPFHNELLNALAGSADLLWPQWYGGSLPLEKGTDPGNTEIADRLATRQMLRANHRINAAWLRAAIASCRRGRIPIVPWLPPAVQAAQLSLALAESVLMVAVVVRETAPPSGSLFGFSRSLEWLGRQTGARVFAILPMALSARSELDGISSRAWHGPSSCLTEAVDVVASSPERTHLVSPFVGRPHPASPGEQALAKALLRDPRLQSLFRFNEPIITCFDNRYLVDLVWPNGRVIVEVDGYGCHSDQSAFNADRHRDYELLVSGYLVLRLPHEFVVEDTELAVERVRDVVNFRRQHPFVE